MDLPFETDESSGGEGGGGTLASTVLVVDDEPVVRDVCARLLSREPDLVVTLAEDAEQALVLLDSQRFDVLITDKNLPGMGGVELISEARALQPALEAVMITGYSSSESVIAAFAAGASDYILKPFEDLRLVRAKVRAALERRAGRVKGREQARRVAPGAHRSRSSRSRSERKCSTKRRRPSCPSSHSASPTRAAASRPGTQNRPTPWRAPATHAPTSTSNVRGTAIPMQTVGSRRFQYEGARDSPSRRPGS